MLATLGILLTSFAWSAPPEISRLTFVDDAGRARALSDLSGQPLIVLPVYTHCHSTCSTLARNLKTAVLSSGVDPRTFQVFLFSFDSGDTERDLREFRRDLALPASWTIARLRPEGIGELTDALDYRYSRRGAEWLHPNAVAVLDPKLRPAARLNGTSFTGAQVRQSLSVARGATDWQARLGPWLFALAVLGLITSAILIAYVAVSRGAEPEAPGGSSRPRC